MPPLSVADTVMEKSPGTALADADLSPKQLI
jgi:hypothetical protein